MVMHRIYGKAQLNNSANKWGAWWLWRSSQSTPQPITGPLLARAPGLQPRLAQWLMRPWLRQPVLMAPGARRSWAHCRFSIKLLYLLILKPCEHKHSSEFTQYNYKNILSWVHVSFMFHWHTPRVAPCSALEWTKRLQNISFKCLLQPSTLNTPANQHNTLRRIYWRGKKRAYECLSDILSVFAE